MVEEIDIYEGLDEHRKDLVYLVCNMLSWARAFYSNASHLPTNDPHTLSILGSLASAYRNCYQELRMALYHARLPDKETYAKIEDIRAHIKKRGSEQGDVIKCFGPGEWRPVDAATINGDIMRVYADFKQTFVKRTAR